MHYISKIYRPYEYICCVTFFLFIAGSTSIMCTCREKNRMHTNINFMLLLHIGNSVNCNIKLNILQGWVIQNMKSIRKYWSKLMWSMTRVREIRMMVHTSWLIVGWSHPVLIAFIVAMASNAPAAPRPCPIID